jgi:endonuclease YncB( thermonuclease family)
MDGRDYGCGARSTAAMHSLVDDEELTCERLDVDRYGRWIARCLRVRDGLDVAGALVRAGWAVAFRHYSSDYIGEENAARAEGAGLWAGRFDEPSVWRRERRSGR